MNSLTDVVSRSPWHEGEVAIQKTVGVADQMEYFGPRVILDHLIDQHRRFFPLLPYVVIGTVDRGGSVWATMLAGNPGFLQARTDSTLRVTATASLADPAREGLNDGSAIGLLGIDLRTRRRNRLNGRVRRIDGGTFDIEVDQSYGNCSQYIHIRNFAFDRDPSVMQTEAADVSSNIDDSAKAMIRNASTFFIASYVDLEDGSRQVDVSHKGGKPGFVHVDQSGTVTIPDFAGNLYFNTLGNILVNPKCGLVFIDFATGDMLQLSGDGEVILDSPEIASFQGAERLLKFNPEKVVFRKDAVPIRWGSDVRGTSPSVSMTGNWTEAVGRLEAAKLRSAWRQFKISGIVDESSTIRSFYLEPTDGAGLMPQKAGQYLPIRVRLPGTEGATLRNYTLSCSPSDNLYRLSVKRDGAVSQYLHSLKSGDMVEAREAAGDFTVDTRSSRFAVFLAAGIGITPMLAMLRDTVYEGLRKGQTRPSWLVYSARKKEERAFDDEIHSLLIAGKGAVRVTRVLSDVSCAEKGDYEVAGRIDMGLLSEVLPFEGYPLEDGYDFYLCGPGTFMQDVYDGLRKYGIPDERIHAEAFGPASFKRQGLTELAEIRPATGPVQVTFSRSGKKFRWTPEAGTLLEFARSSGVPATSSCGVGVCGSCRINVLDGAVAYRRPPTGKREKGEALICCGVPASTSEGEAGLTLDL